MCQLLGVSVRRLNDDSTLLTEGRSYEFQANAVNLDVLEGEEFAQQATALRGSIMIVGPLLSRYGRAMVPQPGGDKIGRRRLDTHFLGMEKLGAIVTQRMGGYKVEADKLKGCYMLTTALQRLSLRMQILKTVTPERARSPHRRLLLRKNPVQKHRRKPPLKQQPRRKARRRLLQSNP